MLCTNRELKHLVIVAGSSCSGKTTIIREMLAGYQPALCSGLGMTQPYAQYLVIPAYQMATIEKVSTAFLVLHFDLYAFSEPELLSWLAELLKTACQTTVLTLNPSGATLVKRNGMRMIQEFLLLLRSPIAYRRRFLNRINYLSSSRRAYRKSDFAESAHESWQRYLRSFEIAEHIIVVNDEAYISHVNSCPTKEF